MNPNEEIKYGDSTDKLAILSLDWDRIRAVDILKMLSSVLENPKKLKSVKIYQQEKQNGAKDESSDDENYECIAIAEFKSKKYAKKVYNECDGCVIGATNDTFDLRFIGPDYKTGKLIDEASDCEDYDHRSMAIGSTSMINKSKRRGEFLENLFRAEDIDLKIANNLIVLSDEEDEEIKLEEEIKMEESKKKKKSKHKEKIKEMKKKSRSKENTIENFDPNDERFAEIYTNEDFIIDSTKEIVKRNKSLKSIIREKRKRYDLD
ncbi:ESF1 like protein [Astathelohania contejeani]|uniref:ESF1 like protein n=1 Tax=Astathelohania contejeani TaxID=164912 RepID=A0ABQ7HZD0_9MICR|nr:ESF1 like protein [Thelohania contejeani]